MGIRIRTFQHPVVIVNKTTARGDVYRDVLVSGAFQQVYREASCAVRVGTSGGMKGVRAMAFATSDGENYVVELLNSLREAVKVNVEF